MQVACQKGAIQHHIKFPTFCGTRTFTCCLCNGLLETLILNQTNPVAISLISI
jgi:hypothetical protein